jgi:hypothetical protein
MKLKSFGCSFIFGTDLADDGRNLPTPTPSNHTWPAHLAQHLGMTYECHARPGAGNLQIAERILSNMNNTDPEFFVIGWTWVDRFDYTNSTISNNPTKSKWDNWRTLMPVDNNELAHHYYRGLHSEFKDKLCSLINIKLIIDTLNQKHIPFLMTYMDNLLFDQRWNHTPAVIELQDFVKPYMTQFEQLSFLDWSRRHKFTISDTLHPLESAHRAAADYMIKFFDKQKTIDLAQQVHV